MPWTCCCRQSRSKGFKVCIAFLISFIPVLMSKVSADEGKQILHLAGNNISNIGPLHVRISHQVQYPGQKEMKLAQIYEYRMQGEESRWTTKDVNIPDSTGEWTGNVYKRGDLDASNGQGGYCVVQDFDGTLDDEGEVCIDSPASATFSASTPDRRSQMCRAHLGLELYCPDKKITLPYMKVAELCHSVSVIEAASKSDDGCVRIRIVCDTGTHDFAIDPNRGCSLKQAIWNGSVNEKEFRWQVDYSDFKREGDCQNLPHKFAIVQHIGKQIFTDNGEIAYVSASKPLEESDVRAFLPKGIPFSNSQTGEFGIWGDGKPKLLFSSEAEAREWDKNRKTNYAKLHPRTKNAGKSNSTFFSPFYVIMVAMFCLIGAFLGKQFMSKKT